MKDLFISHASEDKAEVVIPLVGHLTKQGLSLWVDYKELALGDSLRERIDQGLAASRFGVVVVSDSFFAKRWPTRELNGLFALDRDVSGRLLPVWHRVSKETVARHSPMLADIVGIKTSLGLKRVGVEIASRIRRREAPTAEDNSMEALIAEYDAVNDDDGRVRLPRKIAIRDAMSALAPRLHDTNRYAENRTEGGRLALMAMLRQSPRRAELGRIIETCRQTKHRFVWIEACGAVERYVKFCRTTAPQRALAVAEIEALRHRPLYKRSAAVREATEGALEELRTP